MKDRGDFGSCGKVEGEVMGSGENVQKISEAFGKKLQELRQECGLKQKEIAGLLIVAESTYANWEQGRREPSLQYLVEIARIFDVTMDELFDFTQKAVSR